MEGFSAPDKRSPRIVLEANLDYWDRARFPRLKRIIFDNTLDQREAVELVKSAEGRVDLVTDLSPLETLRVAQSPYAIVVKNRASLTTLVGMFNMRKTDSPWRNVRLRQALNLAINREDLIRYGAKGNGLITPALVPVQGFGYNPDLGPYPFHPAKARELLRQAGSPHGLAVTLIAPEELGVQATVVGKMLQQVGLTVELQILDAAAFNQKTLISHLDQPPEKQPWDIALTSWSDFFNHPVMQTYHYLALDGPYDWVMEEPALRQLYTEVLGTVDQAQQENLIRQMERHTYEQAYFLFLYNPITLYAVNKAVQFVPYATWFNVTESGVTDQHWSVRQAAMKTP